MDVATGPIRPTIRRLRALACAAVAVLALAGCGATGTQQPPPPPGPPRSLSILLVNDDGWDAPGITVLRQALIAAGHRVTLVGPAGPASGAGGAVTFTGPPLQLVAHQPDVWSVSGYPADATLAGLKKVMAASPPQLVVSGINSDYNLGATSIHSGTVGAALTAAELGIPAIAASTKVADSAHPAPADYGPSADYMVRLVNALSSRDRPVPPGAILNVNYPRGSAKAAGVAEADVSTAPQIGVGYTEPAPGQLAPKAEPGAQPDPAGTSDIATVARRQVAVSALGVDFATSPQAKDAATAAAGASGP